MYRTFLLIAIVFWSKNNFVFGQLKPTFRLELNNGWLFHEVSTEKWMGAKVPGCVTTDLMANGVIEDVFFEDNAKKYQWIETKDWEYELNFVPDPELMMAENIDLIFDGLDTYADVYINTNKVLESANMFVGHIIPIKDYLVAGTNSIRIYFHSPVLYAKAKYAADELKYPNDNDENKTSVYTRKAAYQYGWDICPRMVSCGIWRSVFIEGWSGAKITDVYIKPIKITSKKARYEAEITIESGFKGDLQLLIKDYRKNEIDINKLIVKSDSRKTKIKVPILINNPQLWSPNGAGIQKIYNIDIELIAGNNVYSISRQVGVRKIEVVNKTDKIGKNFFLKINDIPTYIKGVNCVPLDIFPARVTKERYQKLFADLRNSNVNMIRLWGGGIYESDYFYQLADENGILIWQDFMFSGAMFPSDSTFIQLVKEEADYNVKRLRNHASLAMWCGNNEIQVAWDNWGWQKTYSISDAQANSIYKGYKKIFNEVLPGAINTLDSGVFYFPSSPQSNWGKPIDFKFGDNHYWGVWHGEKPIENFSTDIPRFASEFGLPSLPEMNSIYKFAPKATLESNLITDRMRSYKGIGLLKKYADENYPLANTLTDISYTSNVLQADAVVSAIAAQRGSKPYCMGSLYWQANDCWPGITWSSIDYYGKWKALQFKIKDAYANLLITKKNDGNKFILNIVNDGLKSFSAELDLHIEDFEGKDLWRKDFHLKLKNNENTSIVVDSLLQIVHSIGEQKAVLIAIIYNDEGVLLQQHFFFEKTKNLQLPLVLPSIDICEYGKGFMLTLSTKELLKDVYLSLYNNEATFSNNYFDMLPGSVIQVEITAELPINEVLNNLKIRTMNGELP